MNKNLLYSSIFFSIILFYYCYKYYSNKNILLILLTLIGIITSIQNHMCCSNTLKYIDRIIMIIGFFILLYICNKKNKLINFSGAILASIFYFLSKYNKNTLYHFFTHFFITITIISLL